ncbi:MAG: ATP-binding protein [Alphaproteobacteria bacterium]
MGRLFWKIFLSFWVTLVVIGASVGVVVHLYSEQQIASSTEVASGPRAEFAVMAIALAVEKGGRAAVAPYLETWPARRPPVLIVDADGKDMFGRPVPAASLDEARAQLRESAQTPGVRSASAPDGTRYLVFMPEIANPGAPGRHGAVPPREMLLLRIGVALLAGLLFSAGLAWYMVSPVRHLRRASHLLATGALDTRVGPAMGGRRDEIADLGRDFDDMAGRLQALMGAQKRLLADVSHELRSPLARLQVAAAIARQQPDQTPVALERIEREAGRLDALVNEVLTLSRLEAGVAGTHEEYLDLVGLLEDVVENARFEAQASGRRVELSAEGEMVVRGRAELLRRAFENVLRNAVRYTDPGTAVAVTLTRQAAQGPVTVTVCDRGPGVRPSDLGAIFEPFYSAGNGQGREGREGHGLGLSIAKRAVEAHAGRIRAFNRPGGGLCIEIALEALPPMTT